MGPINELKMYTSFAQNQSDTLKNLSQAEQGLAKELASGGLSSHYEVLENPRVFLQNESAISRIDNYKQTNNVVTQKLQLMHSQIGALGEISLQLGEALTRNRTSQPAVDQGFTTRVNDWLTNMTQLLNVPFGGAYIFSGTSSNIPAVDDLRTMPDPGLGAAPNYNYYLGDTNNIILQASDSDQLTLTVTARDPAIEQLYHALKLCQNWNQNPADPRLGEALDMNDQAIKSLSALKGKVGQSIGELEEITKRGQEHQEFLATNNKAVGFKEQSQVLMESIDARSQLEMSRYLTMRMNGDIMQLVRTLGGS